jgi:hypothetical protein
LFLGPRDMSSARPVIGIARLKFRLLLSSLLVAGIWLTGISPAFALTAEEGCFASKINSARSSRGVPTLSIHSELVSIARRHSQRMASSGTIFHNSGLSREAPDGWKKLGENVGMGPNCDSIHQAFMDSASHRANVLDPDFNFLGVGVVISDGTIYITEVFMEKASQPAAAEPAPAGNTTTTKPKATSSGARRPVARAPAAAAPEPPPPPPPPPGSTVTGLTRQYMDDESFKNEILPSADQQDAYSRYLKELAAERNREKATKNQWESAPLGWISGLAALLAAAVSAML